MIHRSLSLRVPLTKATAIPLICWYPNWKSKLIEALLRRTTGDFVDVGANIGQTLCDYVYAGAPYRYWGIEPNEVCVAILCRIIDRNNLRNCTVLNNGLSDIEATRSLYLGPTHHTDTRATMCPGLRPGRQYRVVEVRVLPLDRMRSLSLRATKVGLIKIDVEGAELSALRGMTTTLAEDRPPVLCEVLLRDKAADEYRYRERSTELMHFLSDLDYEVFRVSKKRVRPHLDAFPTMTFPLQTWSVLRSGQCDYLFMPKEDSSKDLVARRTTGVLHQSRLGIPTAFDPRKRRSRHRKPW